MHIPLSFDTVCVHTSFHFDTDYAHPTVQCLRTQSLSLLITISSDTWSPSTWLADIILNPIRQKHQTHSHLSNASTKSQIIKLAESVVLKTARFCVLVWTSGRGRGEVGEGDTVKSVTQTSSYPHTVSHKLHPNLILSHKLHPSLILCHTNFIPISYCVTQTSSQSHTVSHKLHPSLILCHTNFIPISYCVTQTSSQSHTVSHKLHPNLILCHTNFIPISYCGSLMGYTASLSGLPAYRVWLRIIHKHMSTTSHCYSRRK